MGKQFQAVMRSLVLLGMALILGGCGEHLGVDQHGRKVAVADQEGQWLVINYWAQWCAPCRSEIPELNGLEQRFADGSVRVLGVNFDGLQGEKLSQASEEMGIRFSVLAEDPAARLGLPATAVLPVTYIVDERGRLRERLLGEQTADALVARISALREEG
jgi:thiol-disulfide isomerase/thioredoxin